MGLPVTSAVVVGKSPGLSWGQLSQELSCPASHLGPERKSVLEFGSFERLGGCMEFPRAEGHPL